MKKIPLTEKDIEFLRFKIELEKTPSIFKAIVSVLLMSVLTVFLSGRKPHNVSLYYHYGFWTPFIISSLVFSFLFYFIVKSSIKELENDLNSNEKIVEIKTIWKKDKSFSKQEYRIWVDSDIKEFQKFIIAKEDYDAVQNGHKVTIEFAEKSKMLLSLNLHLET